MNNFREKSIIILPIIIKNKFLIVFINFNFTQLALTGYMESKIPVSMLLFPDKRNFSSRLLFFLITPP